MSGLPDGIQSRGPRKRPVVPKGRRSQFTPALADRLIDAVRAGLSIDAAARLCRVSPSTVWAWVIAGRNGRPAYKGFAEAVDEARADVERKMLATIVQAATDGIPKRTTRIEATEQVTGPDGVTRPVKRTITDERAPSVEAAQWWLRHHLPTRYGHRVEVVPGQDDPLTEHERAELAAHLSAALSHVVLDASSRDDTPDSLAG